MELLHFMYWNNLFNSSEIITCNSRNTLIFTTKVSTQVTTNMGTSSETKTMNVFQTEVGTLFF